MTTTTSDDKGQSSAEANQAAQIPGLAESTQAVEAGARGDQTKTAVVPVTGVETPDALKERAERAGQSLPEVKVPLLVKNEEGVVEVEEFDPADVPPTEKVYGGNTLAEVNQTNVTSTLRDDAMAVAKAAENEGKEDNSASAVNRREAEKSTSEQKAAADAPKNAATEAAKKNPETVPSVESANSGTTPSKTTSPTKKP